MVGLGVLVLLALLCVVWILTGISSVAGGFGNYEFVEVDGGSFPVAPGQLRR